MFIRKDEYIDLSNELEKLRKENTILKMRIEKIQEENGRMRNDLDYEHAENSKHHKILLSISHSIKNKFGNYKELLEEHKKIEALVQDWQSNN